MREMLNPQPVDMIGEDCERLPIGEVTELQIQMGCNHGDSELQSLYLEETEAGNLPEYDPEEFFERFCQPL